MYLYLFIVFAPQCFSNSDNALKRIRHKSDHGISWVARYSSSRRIRFIGHFLGVLHGLDWRSYQWSNRRNWDPERWRHNCKHFPNSFVLVVFSHSGFVLFNSPCAFVTLMIKERIIKCFCFDLKVNCFNAKEVYKDITAYLKNIKGEI